MDLEKMLKYFFQTSHLPMAVYKEQKLVREFGVRKFEPNPAFHYVQPILHTDGAETMDLTMDREGVICGFVRDRQSGLTVIAGPVLEFPCTKKKAFAILKTVREPLGRTEELVNFFAKIPGMPLVTFYKNLSFLNYIINGEEPEDDYMDRIEQLLGKEMELKSQRRPGVHSGAEVEARLLSCVEFGKTEELDHVMRSLLPQNNKMGQAAQDSIRSVRNIMIASVAIVARSAAKGGMDYEEALELSDLYLQKLDAMDSYDEIVSLWGGAVFDYTTRVQKIRSLNPQSGLARKVAGYVQSHLYCPVTAEEIAAASGYHISYLSRAFKQETGRNIRDYINAEKVEEAKHLLAFSNKPIMEIAMQLGFSSQAYFTTVFKRITEMTPAKYREMRRQ